VFQVTTHVEYAGGFAGSTRSSPTESGASHVLLTGTATTLDTMAAGEAVGQDDLTTIRWYRTLALAAPGVRVIADRSVTVWSTPDAKFASWERSTT